jgi:hypothetical protein
VFTARYALSPYIKQIRFVFKGLREYNIKLVGYFEVARETFYKLNFTLEMCIQVTIYEIYMDETRTTQYVVIFSVSVSRFKYRKHYAFSVEYISFKNT